MFIVVTSVVSVESYVLGSIYEEGNWHRKILKMCPPSNLSKTDKSKSGNYLL